MNKKGIESTVLKAILILSVMAIITIIIIVIAVGIKNKTLVLG